MYPSLKITNFNASLPKDHVDVKVKNATLGWLVDIIIPYIKD